MLLSKGIQLPLGETEAQVRESLNEAGSELHALDKSLFDFRDSFPDVRTYAPN
jgi:hypothetical protein